MYVSAHLRQGVGDQGTDHCGSLIDFEIRSDESLQEGELFTLGYNVFANTHPAMTSALEPTRHDGGCPMGACRRVLVQGIGKRLFLCENTCIAGASEVEASGVGAALGSPCCRFRGSGPSIDKGRNSNFIP